MVKEMLLKEAIFYLLIIPFPYVFLARLYCRQLAEVWLWGRLRPLEGFIKSNTRFDWSLSMIYRPYSQMAANKLFFCFYANNPH